MLYKLKTQNIGPMPEMELDFGERLNILTGDNGLGKSFLLDIAWWALTFSWPAEVNPRLTSGMMARPYGKEKATIEFALDTKRINHKSFFNRQEQAWTELQLRPVTTGLVLSAMIDGSFAVWDPARNVRKKNEVWLEPRLPYAYVFSPGEVWNGLENGGGSKRYCNGLIADWAGWQKEDGEAFAYLRSVLDALSPSDTEKITPGELTRISIDDVRDIPTLMMPYGEQVPVLHASAGMRRIIALAYLLVWSWEEHKKACELLNQPTASQVVFLIDEIEAHLHPKWQRKIVGALMKVMDSLTKDVTVQIIAATHSPLVMASVEPFFDLIQDAWFDLDLRTEANNSHVELKKRDF